MERIAKETVGSRAVWHAFKTFQTAFSHKQRASHPQNLARPFFFFRMFFFFTRLARRTKRKKVVALVYYLDFRSVPDYFTCPELFQYYQQQGSHAPGKSLKVLEFENKNSRLWKSVKSTLGPWKTVKFAVWPFSLTERTRKDWDLNKSGRISLKPDHLVSHSKGIQFTRWSAWKIGIVPWNVLEKSLNF